MNIAGALAEAKASGLDRLDAQLLLLHALGRPATQRSWLAAHDTDPLSDSTLHEYLKSCRRRASGEPLAYIVGRKEFFGLELAVDARVLVPRPDTETLVEWALEILPAKGCAPSVIDLGCGSGAIALAIKNHRGEALVEAVEASADALQVATTNAERLALQVGFRHGSWLTGISARYHLIVSNPPYVAAGDPHLASLTHEPLQALAAGADGLQDIRTIICQAPARLHRGGWLLLEHGYEQAAAVRGLMRAAGFQAVASRRDLAGIERCCGGQWLELG